MVDTINQSGVVSGGVQATVTPIPSPVSPATPSPTTSTYNPLPEAEAAAQDTLNNLKQPGGVNPVSTQSLDMTTQTTSGGGSSSTTTQKGVDVTGLPAYQDWLESNAQAKYTFDQLREAHLKKAEAEFAGKQQMAELEKENSILMADKEKVRQDKLASTELQVKDEMDKVANFEFKPWTEKGNNKIAAVIGIALAGISQMLSHGSIGKNTGLAGGPTSNQAIDKQIALIDKVKEDDMKLQKLQWERAKTATEQAKTRYGMLVDKFKDERVADAALRAQQSKAVEAEIGMKLAEYARNTGGGLDMLKDKFGYIQFKQKADADRLQFETMKKDKVTTTSTKEDPRFVVTTKMGEKDTLGAMKEANSLRGEYLTQTKDMRNDIREMSNIDVIIRQAGEGNQAAINQLNTAMTKLHQSGNFTEGDVSRSDANASLWQKYKSEATKKVWGEQTDDEKAAIKHFFTAYKFQKERELATVASNYYNLAGRQSLDPSIVIIDPTELEWAKNGTAIPKRKDLSKYGGKPVKSE